MIPLPTIGAQYITRAAALRVHGHSLAAWNAAARPDCNICNGSGRIIQRVFDGSAAMPCACTLEGRHE